ncbi:MAG: hypothetical protein Q7U57_15530 [Methylovulum sp.]|nr:hypothetical protein [Methylovulum sp.]
MLQYRPYVKTALILAASCSVCPASAEPGLFSALTSGRFDLFLRYRFETADDAAPALATAYASTLRSAIGYQSAPFHDADVYVQLEDVQVVGDGQSYNDGGANDVTDRAVIADPEGLELQQAFFRYGGLPRSVLTVGRQDITHRQAPLHRYIGNVLWRQNWQSYDAVRLINLSLPQTTLDYAYVWQVNRIFGEHNPHPDAGQFAMDSQLLNIQYSGLPFTRLEAYSYLLDFTTPTSAYLSTATVGLRLQGEQSLAAKTKLLYTGEYAHQNDYGNNPHTISAGYLLAEFGLSHTLDLILHSAALKFSYEMLTGDGGANAFQTPLGTNHAFQGFADRFLVTPGDGIQDFFGTLTLKLSDHTQFITIYHRFVSDRDSYDYGTELNVVLERSFGEHLLAGIQYASYRADGNPDNRLRNTQSGQAFDLSKCWLYVQFSY